MNLLDSLLPVCSESSRGLGDPESRLGAREVHQEDNIAAEDACVEERHVDADPVRLIQKAAV